MGQTLSLKRCVLAVLCGGFLGTLVRYVLSIALQRWLGKSWPYDILAINLSGALLLALINTLADGAFLIGPTRRLFINTGFMGAYTTFSSLALGDVLLLNKGQILPTLLYLAISLAGGLGAVLLGDWLGKILIKRQQHLMGKTIPEPAFRQAAPPIDIRDEVALSDAQDEVKARKS